MPLLDAGITISIGGGGELFAFSPNLILYVIVAAIVGLIAEMIVGWRVPFGIIGATIAGIIGIWLLTRVIIIGDIGDIVIWDIQLIRAIVGAIIFIALWHLLTSGLRRGRG